MSKELLELNQKLGENISAMRAEFDSLSADGKETSQKMENILEAQAKFDTLQQDQLKEKTAIENSIKEQAENMELLEQKIIGMSKPAVIGSVGKEYKDLAEYKAINAIAQHGYNKAMLNNPEYKDALRTDVNAQGGYLVPVAMAGVILKEILEVSDIRKYSRVWSGMGKSFSIPVRKGTGVIKAKGEGEESEETSQSYRNETLTGFRQTATIPMTLDMLNFSSFDVEAQALADIKESFANYEGEKFLIGAGSGAKEPEGILVNSDVVSGKSTESTGSVTNAQLFEDICSMIGDLKNGYNGQFGFNKNTLVKLRLAKSSAGGYLWQVGGETMPTQLMGQNYAIFQDMKSVSDGAGAKVAMYADLFKGYSIYDSVNMSMIRDEFSNAKNAMVDIILHRWSTGQVVIPEAIKLLEINS